MLKYGSMNQMLKFLLSNYNKRRSESRIRLSSSKLKLVIGLLTGLSVYLLLNGSCFQPNMQVLFCQEHIVTFSPFQKRLKCDFVFITEICKPQLFSLHAPCLHTRLTEFFLNPVACSVLPFIWQLSSLMNTLKGEYPCLRKISINVSKSLAVLLLPVYLFIRFFDTALYCCLFTT